jgi:phosphoglycerol transferase MdoB-like AlkP superfamily enzyme
MSFGGVDTSLITLLKTFGVGLFYDIVAASYYFIPLALYLTVIPQKLYNSKIHRYMLMFIAFSIVYAMIFNGVSEYFFWEEFGKRFNFIAVDYLVYTHEVIKNIQESYPLPAILSAIGVVSGLIVYMLRKHLFGIEDTTTFRQRLKISIPLLLLPILFFNILDKQGLSNVSNNIYNNELAKNGTYSLFSAFRHNELDYDEFYKTLDIHVVMKTLKKLEGFDDKTVKVIPAAPKVAKYNVILIMVESLSAEYMGIYGNVHHLTPHLDALAKHSLFFNNLFATGTRTVRGMEAVTLSVPPTPGRSIIKRSKNDNMDSFGNVFKANGYDNKFIYAGHGYFDNMNDFFSKNGFNIVDRTDFQDDEVTFSNVWGVCDEDLLAKVAKEADKSYAAHKPFFSFVMTTSNHRPYTYPDGKIDIPSHTGRTGGIKYTDYAIHNFIEQAKKKPWFDNTVFVIVADHNGGSAGKVSLPLYRYRIPLMVYAPKIIKPRTVSKLASQIDTLPTVLHILGIGYRGRFYGNNILSEHFKERAFIGNYQKLGYVKNGYLYYLTPDKQAHKKKIQALSLRNVQYEDVPITPEEEKEVITYYQSASYFYKHNKSRTRQP